jgi:hypothetical protein
MTGHASPATTLHDVVVLHDQTGALWKASSGAIRAGRVVVFTARSAPPEGFFTGVAATYTVRATDAANRSRSFPNVILTSHNAKEYVFD